MYLWYGNASYSRGTFLFLYRFINLLSITSSSCVSPCIVINMRSLLRRSEILNCYGFFTVTFFMFLADSTNLSSALKLVKNVNLSVSYGFKIFAK